MSVWGYTLEQIRAATKQQIINKITQKLEGMTKKKIIMLLLEIITVRRTQDTTYGSDGQIESHLAVEEDALGAKVGSTLITWSYYPTGEVDEIVVSERDADDVEIGQYTIKHYLDRRQPTVS